MTPDLTGGKDLAGDLTRGCDFSGRSYTWQSVGGKTLHVAYIWRETSDSTSSRHITRGSELAGDFLYLTRT